MKKLKGHIPDGKILIKVREPEEKTSSGIYIPPTVTDQKTADVIIGYGGVKTGDVIYFKENGYKVHIEGEDYLLLRETDVLYII